MHNLGENGSAMGILLIGGLVLHVMNKIKQVPRALIPGMGLLPTAGLAVHDFIGDLELPDLDNLIVNRGPQGGLSGIVHTPRPMDPIIDMPGPGGMLSGILDHGLIRDIVPQPPKPRRKPVNHNLFEDEDPAIGPMADHPVEKDPGEDTHGFGGYDTESDKVQTEPKQIADTQIRTWGFGMFEEDQFNL